MLGKCLIIQRKASKPQTARTQYCHLQEQFQSVASVAMVTAGTRDAG